MYSMASRTEKPPKPSSSSSAACPRPSTGFRTLRENHVVVTCTCKHVHIEALINARTHDLFTCTHAYDGTHSYTEAKRKRECLERKERGKEKGEKHTRTHNHSCMDS